MALALLPVLLALTSAAPRRTPPRTTPSPLERSLPLLRLRGGSSSADSAISPVSSEAELELLLSEAGTRLVVLDFYADWCGPCKKIAPHLERLARASGGRVLFAKVNVDEARALAASHGVRSMPTFLLLRRGAEVGRIVGADRARLEQVVARAQMHPVLRVLSGEKLLAAAAAAYLLWASTQGGKQLA
ncbi:hypothetical protein AB1Y20_010905 [Prymnesium parvum]|uniref:Thioredoxin domain-containing protein n=1 Tax=Prymnesium parvum TaxID=97485 RepID=A0AB34IR12_PRYPA